MLRMRESLDFLLFRVHEPVALRNIGVMAVVRIESVQRTIRWIVERGKEEERERESSVRTIASYSAEFVIYWEGCLSLCLGTAADLDVATLQRYSILPVVFHTCCRNTR